MLGILIIIQRFRTGKSSMRIRISDWQIDYFRTLNAGSVTGWDGWRAGQSWSWLWSPLTASVGWRCSCVFASPACLWILCGAMLARRAAGHVVLMKHCRVSLHRSPQRFIPRKLNSLYLLFSDVGAWLYDEIFHFLYCGAQTAFFGHFGHIRCQAHVRVFQQYPTSLRCDGCCHVENLQDISCCF
jgi:hypothetical protein